METAQSGPATFSEILGASWGLFKKFFKPVLAGAVIISAINLLPFLVPLVTRMDYLTSPSFIAYAVIMGVVAGVVVGVVSYLVFLFYLVLGVEQGTEGAMKRSLSIFFPTIGIGVMTLIRTYAWIPLLLMVLAVFLEQARAFIPLLIIAAIVLGVWLGPRYMPAQVIYVLEKNGVMASVNRSYAVTKGYWGKVVGNVLLMGLIAFAVSFVSGMVFGVLGGGGTALSISSSLGESPSVDFARLSAIGFVSQFAMQLIGQLVAALNVFFLVHLTKTIVAHPR